MTNRNKIERKIEMVEVDGRFQLSGFIRIEGCGWSGVAIETSGTKTETFREAKKWFCHSDESVRRRVFEAVVQS